MVKIFAKAIVSASMCFIVALALFTGAPSKAIGADTIKIGDLNPWSGPFAQAGRQWLAGIRFAVDEQNAKGGLLGKKIEIITEDDEIKPDVATRKAKKLILEDKVDFISSGTGSHIAIALNKVASGYKKIYINYGGMTDYIQGKEFTPYAFRVFMGIYNVNSALAMVMASKPYRRYYIINQDYAAGRDFARGFREQLKIYLPQAEIVGEDFAPLGTKDFAPYVTKVMAAKADVIFTGNYGSDLTLLIKQGRSLGLKQPFPFVCVFAAQDANTSYEIKDDIVGIYTVQPYSLWVDTPENKQMVAKYHEQHKSDKDFDTWWPDSLIGSTILCWKMVFAAAEKAGSVDPDKFIKAFEGFSYQTPVGLWTMRTCDHQLMMPMFGGRMVAGENPFFNGSIRPDVKFPWLGKDIETFPASKVTIPATADYNPRCR